ncbi:cytochrome P450 [Desarmillaria tabescens]|uniref:Cytochrome P450 n=1 Tax=Armillaria tabescens TaxID=1929756 RepID=A0AA39K6A4_ARMTA|nr:cytochrome P450 [Desarmillaria tabescens]KAK0455354.1 cytochrome P450 [Desarmillaria tabescens]
MHSFLYLFGVFVMAYAYARLLVRQRSLRRVRGPPRPSFLLGHEWLIRNRENIGDLEMAWYQQYGGAYRVGGCFGQDVLVISDPKALQYVFHTSGYRYPKSPEEDRFTNIMLGPGVGTVAGEIHQRQRKILGPAFSTSQLRQFLVVFQSAASKLVEKMKESTQTGKVLDIFEWTTKTSLDIIGKTSFRYEFNAMDTMDGQQTELESALHNMLGESQMWPSSSELLYLSLWRLLPDWGLSLLERISTRGTRRLVRFRTTAEKAAQEVFEKQVSVLANDDNLSEKSIINVLALSHLNNDPKKKMTAEEIYAQFATFIMAGHDTTALTTAWVLYELARNPSDQATIRDEILQLKANISGRLSSNDYDSMLTLNAAIKETLRLHPLNHVLHRIAAKDDIIPLGEPITTADGRISYEVPVTKGQIVTASVYTYNRLPSVWGDDAEQWNPQRFLRPREKEQVSLGIFSNLMSFSGGVHSCIGWRFAIMEIQALVTELLSTFEFGLPEEDFVMLQSPGQRAVFPLVQGRVHEGIQIPLRVVVSKSE